MRRREFLGLVSGAATWPISALAQQSAVPMIGFLRVSSAADAANLVTAFQKGLTGAGFVEGQNVIIEYRFADGQSDRFPGLVADLMRRQAAVSSATGCPC